MDIEPGLKFIAPTKQQFLDNGWYLEFNTLKHNDYPDRHIDLVEMLEFYPY